MNPARRKILTFGLRAGLSILVLLPAFVYLRAGYERLAWTTANLVLARLSPPMVIAGDRNEARAAVSDHDAVTIGFPQSRQHLDLFLLIVLVAASPISYLVCLRVFLKAFLLLFVVNVLSLIAYAHSQWGVTASPLLDAIGTIYVHSAGDQAVAVAIWAVFMGPLLFRSIHGSRARENKYPWFFYGYGVLVGAFLLFVALFPPKRLDAEGMQQLAEKGHAAAQFNLALFYYDPPNGSPDYSEAADWFRLAAKKGHASAQNNLGYLFQKGQGVEKSDEKAFQWYQKAAVQGHAGAQANLADMYLQGKGTETDLKKAVSWLHKASRAGVAQAQFRLGVLYYQGRGVPKDLPQAQKWFQRAADQGMDKAAHNLELISKRLEQR